MFRKELLVRSVTTEAFYLVSKYLEKQFIWLLTELSPGFGDRLANKTNFLPASVRSSSTLDSRASGNSSTTQKISEVLGNCFDRLLLNVYREKLTLIPTTFEKWEVEPPQKAIREHCDLDAIGGMRSQVTALG